MSEVVIHVGVHKTGSTSIQKTLDGCRRELELIGIKLYKGSNHQVFYRAFTDVPESFHRYYRSWNRQPDQHLSRESIKQYFNHYSGYTHLVTAEDLSLLSYNALKRMRDFLTSECGMRRIRVVCFMRNPIDYLNSSLQQYIKPGLVTLDNLVGNSFPNYKYQGFPCFTGGYEAVLQRLLLPVPGKLTNVFGSSNVQFVNFEHARKTGLTENLLNVLVDKEYFHWLDEKTVNESMSHEACVLLAEYNNRNPLFDDHGSYSHRRNTGNALVTMLRHIKGRKAKLVDKTLIDARWLNEEVQKINTMAGKFVMSSVPDDTESHDNPYILDFSNKALRNIEVKLPSSVVSTEEGRTRLTVNQIESINEVLEKRRSRITDIKHAVRKLLHRRNVETSH